MMMTTHEMERATAEQWRDHLRRMPLSRVTPEELLMACVRFEQQRRSQQAAAGEDQKGR